MDELFSIKFWLENFGFGGAVLFCVLYFGRKFLIWVRPHAEEILSGHKLLLKVAADNIPKNTEQLSEIQVTQKEHGEMIEEIHKTVVK